MADKKKDQVSEEKIYTIPLRREYLLATRVQRTKKSIIGVKKYIIRHTHASDIRISTKLNDVLWASGAKKPLKSIKVKVNIIDGVANARLPEEITLEEEKQKFLAEKGKKKKETKPETQSPEEKPAEEVKAAPEELPKTEEKMGEEPKKEEPVKEEPKADAPVEANPDEKK